MQAHFLVGVCDKLSHQTVRYGSETGPLGRFHFDFARSQNLHEIAQSSNKILL